MRKNSYCYSPSRSWTESIWDSSSLKPSWLVLWCMSKIHSEVFIIFSTKQGKKGHLFLTWFVATFYPRLPPSSFHAVTATKDAGFLTSTPISDQPYGIKNPHQFPLWNMSKTHTHSSLKGRYSSAESFPRSFVSQYTTLKSHRLMTIAAGRLITSSKNEYDGVSFSNIKCTSYIWLILQYVSNKEKL